jgi:hypothetical protein
VLLIHLPAGTPFKQAVRLANLPSAARLPQFEGSN